MTNEHDKALDLELEAFFEAARDIPDDPSPDLLARILADAYSEQDATDAVLTAVPDTVPAPAEVPRRGLLSGLLDGLGGWPVLAGLATATVAGVWIGYNPPAAFDALSLQLIDSAYGVTMDSSLPDYDGLWVDS